MKQVHDIREKRYGQHIKNTLKPGKKIKRAGLISKAKKKIHLIRAPVADEQEFKSEDPENEGEIQMEIM